MGIAEPFRKSTNRGVVLFRREGRRRTLRSLDRKNAGSLSVPGEAPGSQQGASCRVRRKTLRLQRRPHECDRFIEPPFHQRRRQSQDGVAGPDKLTLPSCISGAPLLVIDIPVNFDDQAPRWRNEVRDELTEDDLALEGYPKTLAAEPLPQEGLRRSGRKAHLPRPSLKKRLALSDAARC